MEPALLSISQVNNLEYEEFTQVLGNLVEHCPLCAAAIWKERPFTSAHHLWSKLCSFLDQLPDAGKEGILRLHPDLAGRMAEQGALTLESQNEQKSAGLDCLTADEKATLQRSNALYKEKFGFPFIICVRENRKEAILKGIVQRLDSSFQQELGTAMEEVKKICRLRLLSIVSS